MQAIFTDQGGGVASLLQGAAEGVVVIEGVVEVGVADRGVTLMHAGQQTTASRSADRSAGVVLVEDHTLPGHAVEVGRAQLFFASDGVLPKDTNVSVTEVIR